MDFSPVGDEYPNVVQRLRKFRAFDEPEKKHIFHSFLEFRAPHKPPMNLGKSGDVYLNENVLKLYMRLDCHWTRWDSTPIARLKHPELQHRYLWIVQITGQRAVDFVSLDILKKFKIINSSNLLKSIVSAQQKRILTHKRKSEVSLNTKKGKKGRLSNLKPPSDSSGVDVPSTLLLTSLSAPVQRPISSSSSSATPPRTLAAPSTRVHSKPSLQMSPPVSPQTERDRKLLERNEFLERENEELRMSIRILKELEKNNQTIQQGSLNYEGLPGLTLSIDDDGNCRQPQLQSPPPTPSNPSQLSNDFADRGIAHCEPLLPFSKPESLPPVIVGDFVAMDEDRKPSIQVNPKSDQTATVMPSRPRQECIDLTLSDDDEPCTHLETISHPSHVVSSEFYDTSYPSIRTRTSNLLKNTTPAQSTSLPQLSPASYSRNETPASNRPHATPGVLHVPSHQAAQRHTPTQKLSIPVERPAVRSFITDLVPNQIDDNDDIVEITPDQFRASVKAGKRKADVATVEDSSTMQITSWDKTYVPHVKSEPLVDSIKTQELPNDLVWNSEASAAASASAMREHSVDGRESPDNADVTDANDFNLVYPEDEPRLPSPPRIQYIDIKAEVANVEVQNVQAAQWEADVNMYDVEMNLNAPQDEEDGNAARELAEGLGLTLDILRVIFRVKKGFKRCKFCDVLKYKERQIKFPVQDRCSMLHHIAIRHQGKNAEREEIQNLQNMIYEFGLHSEQLQEHLEYDA
ncbi:hypothetical protein J3R30DRAFT_3790180 [Lentinula aciculospora]|uniref:Uncharacterized protein n=1 Tax=Lentinula aciculospora TaxID=153920 RepID=A0A9W9ARQ5_9AGAR|nr:hypothetical protein J3R30DRAFT_3790180 [Lentinula aciculospora]